jgi:hypothetical protein
MIPSRRHLQCAIIAWLDIILQQNKIEPIEPKDLPNLALNLIQNIREQAYGCLAHEAYEEDVKEDNPRPYRNNEEHDIDMLDAMREITKYMGYEDDPLFRKIDGYIDAWLEREYQHGCLPDHYRPANMFRDDDEEVMDLCLSNEHVYTEKSFTDPQADGFLHRNKSKRITQHKVLDVNLEDGGNEKWED